MEINCMERERAKAVTASMTLEEKVHLWTGNSYWSTYPMERFGLSECILSDGPHGVRRVKERDHLGQAVNERATGFPASAAMGATWNKELLREVGEALGRECQSMGIDLLLGPAVNMKRSVLGGRNFEYLSEDPVLAGKLAAQIVNGIQSTGTGACMKHFACNNSEAYRMTADVNVDERTLHELYLKVFEIIVKESGPMAVMGAYNKVNGTYACENKYLLTDVLRNAWGFTGMVLSDWLAVDECVEAVKAGLNLEMPQNPAVYEKLEKAVLSGELPEELLNKRTEELLGVLFTLQKNRNPKPVDWEKHSAIARRTAAESMVLLKNEGNLLPADWSRTKSLAVLGDFAVHPRTQGGGSSSVETEQQATILEELKRQAPEGLKIRFAAGYDREGDTTEELLKEAAKAARDCERVIIFAGLPESYESEGYDRSHMRMPEGHVRLIDEIVAIRTDILVVLSNGSPIEMPFLETVDAVIEAWLLGQETAGALADVIFHRAQPSGRMPETFPKHLEEEAAGVHFSVDEGTLYYGERMMTGYRYYEKRGMTPAVPFGFGLSYTTFDYSDMTVTKERVTEKDELEVRVKVKNTGSYPGYEVVQLYVSNRQTRMLHPEKELKDFEKLYLQPGEEREVCFVLNCDAFSCYSRKAGGWITEPGEYGILIGASVKDIRGSVLIRLEQEEERHDRLTEKSTLEEWLAHPCGRKEAERMLSHYRGFGMGEGRSFEELSHFVKRIMLEMPMPGLITASDGSFTHEELSAMVNRAAGKEECR